MLVKKYITEKHKYTTILADLQIPPISSYLSFLPVYAVLRAKRLTN